MAGPACLPATVSGGWRPALYSRLLHRLANRPALHFDGEPIASTSCGRSALISEQARNGPHGWQHWPRCPECAMAQQYDGT